jgi:hypothetical protein
MHKSAILSEGELYIIHCVKQYICKLQTTINNYCKKNMNDFPVKIISINDEVSKACGISSSTSKTCTKRLNEIQDKRIRESTLNPTGIRNLKCD